MRRESFAKPVKLRRRYSARRCIRYRVVLEFWKRPTMPYESSGSRGARNVLGGPLAECSTSPVTGFYRDGCCHTGPNDAGSHTVCAIMTAEFLAFSKSRGNDLSTPRPEYQFPGLNPGDGWCLCVSRWREAFEANCAPQVFLAATHEAALDVVTLAMLQTRAVSA
jgi:uncharacterized protein